MSTLRKAYSFDDVMLIPRYSTLDSRSDADLSTTIASIKLKIPIIAANMSSVCGAEMASALGKLGGLGIIHRMCSVEEQAHIVVKAAGYSLGADLDSEGAYPIGFSIGVGDDWRDRMEACRNYAHIVCLDIAHAHHERVVKLLKEYYATYKDYPIIIGQVATPEAVKLLISTIPNIKYLRTTAFKTSIGGGSLCTTRIKTGFGIPTFQAVVDIRNMSVGSHFPFVERGLTLIADGGIKNAGDIVKSLGAGAHAVMVGNLLAGTDEAPGEMIIQYNRAFGDAGQKYKLYRGSASFSDKVQRGEEPKHIEGEETLVPYKGPVAGVISSLVDGIRSGFSYGGAHTLQDLHENAEFVEITPLGFAESLPHGK